MKRLFFLAFAASVGLGCQKKAIPTNTYLHNPDASFTYGGSAKPSVEMTGNIVKQEPQKPIGAVIVKTQTTFYYPGYAREVQEVYQVFAKSDCLLLVQFPDGRQGWIPMKEVIQWDWSTEQNCGTFTGAHPCPCLQSVKESK